jgi:hypothetical protein
VSALEDRIRDALRADAATVRQESIPGAPGRRLRPAPGRPGSRRARSRRARVLIPLAAAAAVGVVVAGVTVAAPLLRGSGRPGPGASALGHLPTPLHLPGGSQPTSAPAVSQPVPKPTLGHDASRGVPASASLPGVPGYYVTVYVAPVATTDSLVVRDTATGKVAGQIRAPGGSVFDSIAATAGDRTFLTAISPASGTSCFSKLYQFSLDSQGRPGPLVLLPVTVPVAISQGVGDLAITPDGRTIAYYGGCDGGADEEVAVIDLATRHVGVWAVAMDNKDPLQDIIRGLSLTADGRLLGFGTFPGARILTTSAPAGSVYERSQTVSRTTWWAALSGDGSSLYGCSISPSGLPLPATGTLTYNATSLAGHGQHLIAQWAHTVGPQCWASLDTTGNYLLVQFPTVAHGVDDWSRPAVLDLRTGRLTNIDAPAFYGPFDIAW